MLGAGVSADALVRVETLPPLTISGAASGFVVVVVSDDLVDAEGEATSSSLEVSSIMFWTLFGADPFSGELGAAAAAGFASGGWGFGELGVG